MNPLTLKQRWQLFWARRNGEQVTLITAAGLLVEVHPDFAEHYWKRPKQYQRALEEYAADWFN